MEEGSGFAPIAPHTHRPCRLLQEADLRALESERTKLTSKLSSDYGPDSAFAPLDSHCFSAAVDKYTYEARTRLRHGLASAPHGDTDSRGTPASASIHSLLSRGGRL